MLLLPVLFFAACNVSEPTIVPAKITFDNADELGFVSLDFSSKAASQTISFKADGEWHIVIQASEDWISVSPSSGQGDGTISVSVSDNPAEQSRRGFVSFVCDGLEQKVMLKVYQDQLYVRKIVFEGAKGYVPKAGGTFLVNVKTVYVDDWTVSCDDSWLSVEKADATHLRMICGAAETPRSAKVTLTAVGTEEPVVGEGEFIQWLKADVLDVEFTEEGARDLAQEREIRFVPNTSECSVSLNTAYGSFVPTFSHPMGGSCSGGIYRTDIDNTMMECLNDGFSMEAVVMLSDEPNGKEIKAFSSTKGGGFAIMVNSSSRGNDLTFLLNNGAWQFIKTGVIPMPGVFYHVLGTWDQATGVAKVYLDGVLKGEYSVTGSLQYGTLNPNYITIGGNQNTQTEYNGSWRGDVVSARIFNATLSEKEVLARYHDYAPNGLEIVFSD